MKTIIDDINDMINESNTFRKEDLSDGSTLISNKEESIFNRITPPHGFFTHRPAYFFDTEIGDSINVDDNISIRSYMKAAYLDFIAKKYKAIVRDTDTLIDNKYKDSIENDAVQMGIIYADDHYISDTHVNLKDIAKVEKVITTTMEEANRYLGFRIKYIDLDDFIKGINDNYTIGLDMLRDVLYSEENISTYINGSIETSFIGGGIEFDTTTYNSLRICTMDISKLSNDESDTIVYDISHKILREINNKLSKEFHLYSIIEYNIISIHIAYSEIYTESDIEINHWGNLIYSNMYLSSI